MYIPPSKAGELSKKRKRRFRKRLMKKMSESPKLRTVQFISDPEYRYEVFFHSSSTAPVRQRRQCIKIAEAAVAFVKESCSGGYKIKTHSARYGSRQNLYSIKLKEESDLFMLMMCHRDGVRKIFEYPQNKEAA